MHRPSLALCASVAVALSCAPSRKVVVDGQEMTLDDAASRAFAAAQAAYDASRFEEAARGFARVAEQYADSAYADEARLQRGRALAKLGKLDEAQKALKEIVEGQRESRFRKQAALELAQIQARQGKKEEAVKQQEKAVKLAEGDMKKSLEKSLESYKKGELPPAD